MVLEQVNSLRDKYAPVTTVSTFRKTGEITPDEFVAAGDYLVFKFPTWSWADAEPASLRAPHLPPGKQFLVTRNVPCQRRLDADFAGDAGHEEAIVKDGDDFGSGEAGGDEDGWLRTGGLSSSQPLKVREIRTVDDAGNVGDGQVVEDDDDIPDMEDEDDDEAIIHDTQGGGANGCVLSCLACGQTPISAICKSHDIGLTFPSKQEPTNIHAVHHVLSVLPYPPRLLIGLLHQRTASTT